MAETTVAPQQSPALAGGMKAKSFTFFADVAREMRKVSWPKREELPARQRDARGSARSAA